MRVVILGGSGFLGSALSVALRAAGIDVVLASHRADAEHEIVAWDITDAEQSSRALAQLNPDVVVNLAASGVTRGTGTPEAMDAVNALGPSRLVEAVARATVQPRLVHVSSSRELDATGYGDGHVRYGQSKARGTAAVLEALENGLVDGCVIRVHSAYGPGQPADRFVAWMVGRVRAFEPIELRQPDTALDFVHVDDVADALARAVQSRERIGEIVEVGTGRAATVLEATQIAVGCADADPSLIVCATNGSGRSPHGSSTAADVSTARRHLGWRAKTNLETGLQMLVKAPA